MALRHPGDVALRSAAAAPHDRRCSRSLLRSPSRLSLSNSFVSTRKTSRIQTLPPPSAAAPKDHDSLSSAIAELKLGQQEEEEEQDQEEAADQKELSDQNMRLPERWREIHGRDGWAGLLDPMDPMLRGELIRYGEFAQACYDAFDYDPFSRYCGSSKYSRRRFFASLGMADCGYDVTRYLYATSNINLPNFFATASSSPHAYAHNGSRLWSQRANWIGYVAVSDDDCSARIGRRDVVVAWRGTVTRLEWVADLMDFLKPVAAEGIPCPDPSVKVESGFIDLYTDKDPTCRFCKYSAREQVLSEVRKLVHHYAHDRYHGKGQRFVLASGRDPALVNKACDFLKEHHMVPPYWRQDENKGMIMAHDGRWVQPERQKIDDHPADTHQHLRLLGLRHQHDGADATSEK